MNKVLLLFFASFLGLHLHAQNAKMLCASVNEDGTVVVTWEYAGTTTGLNYTLSRKALPDGSVTTIASPASTETSYIDVTVNANESAFRYYLTTTVSGVQTGTDSINTIFLTVASINNGRNALLNWNSLTDGIHTYEIFRKLSSGNWTSVASTTDLFYQDLAPRVCRDTIYYRVQTGVNLVIPCYSASNIGGALFNDTEPPDTPTSDTVSINNLQKIQLGWKASVEPDVSGYIICSGSPCILLDTIKGKNNTSYIWNDGDPNEIHSFRIVSYDSCSNTSLLTEVQNNMVLSATTKECTKEVSLKWNKYINLSPSVDSYLIYVKNGDLDYALVQQIPSSQESFQYVVPDEYNYACFYVKAANSDRSLTASSNRVCVNFLTPDTAGYLYIKEASVSEDNSQVNLYARVDAAFQTNQYKVFRYTSGESPRQVGTIPYKGDTLLYFADNTAKPNTTPYYYYISVDNACATSAKRSNTVRTIYLRLENQSNSKNKLIWTPYIGWQAIEGYTVYRKTNSTPPVLLASLSASDTTYVDNFGDIPFTEELGYYVIALEKNKDPYVVNNKARSSTAFYSGEGNIILGNAFTPKASTNNIFKPVFIFVEKNNYKFAVYDRWGLLIFETTSVDVGWDGKYKNEYVPVGVYAYKIECLFSMGNKFSKMGMVNVLD